MRCSIVVVSELVLALCVVQTLAAQVPTLRRGARVRVTVPGVSAKPFLGVVDSVNGSTMMLRTSAEVTTAIPFSQVARLEVSHGRKRPMWSKTAPLWLTASAAGVGAIVGYATTPEDDFFGRDFGAVVLGGLGGTLGLLIGTGLAVGVKNDEWEVVPAAAGGSRTSVAPSFYVAPGSRGVTLGMRAAF